MMARIFLSLTAAALLLSGCMVGPDYPGPPRVQVAQWLRGQTEAKSSRLEPVDQQWWKNFNDPVLHDLLVETARENYSVRLAAANIERARGVLDIARAGFFPAISGQAAYQHRRRSENSEFGQFPGISLETSTWTAGFDAGWELDLFGRIRRQAEAGEAAVEAAVYGAEDALVSVQAETARAYMELRAAQALTDIAVNQAELQEKTAELVAAQVEEGQASEYQLARITALAINTRSQVHHYRARAKAAVYALALLNGKPPEELIFLLGQEGVLPIVRDPVHIGLRSDILQRRPDIRQAERVLAARYAALGAAEGSLFPSVNLTGSIGLQSLDAGDFIDIASRTWMVTPSISIPIFNRGELRARVDIAEAEQKAAMLEYEQAVYAALEEVQRALSGYAEGLDSLALQEKALKHTVKMTELAEMRYRAGEDDFLNLSDARERLLQAEQGVVETRLATLNRLISLYKALGGGWSIDNSGSIDIPVSEEVEKNKT